MRPVKYIIFSLAVFAVVLFCWLFLKPSNTASPFFEDAERKVWLHKLYDYRRANQLLPEFGGMETDIVFDTLRNVFDIRHDEPDGFKNRTLDAFWGNIRNVNEYYYWLDFKNLDGKTLEKSKNRLLHLMEKYDLKKNVIVESWHTKELHELSKSGMFTSYWIPHFDSKDSELQEKNTQHIRERLGKYKLNALSAHYSMVPFLEKNFEDCNIHIWTNGLYLKRDRAKIDSLKNIESIKVILVDLD